MTIVKNKIYLYPNNIYYWVVSIVDKLSTLLGNAKEKEYYNLYLDKQISYQ